MSVINQVLQDLEKRHGRSDEARSASPQIRAVGPMVRPAGRRLLMVLLALVLLGAAVFGWRWWRNAQEAPPAAAPVAAKPVAPSQAPIEVPAPAVPVAIAPQPVPTPIAVAPAPPERRSGDTSGAKTRPAESATAAPVAKPKPARTPAPAPAAEEATPAGTGIEKRERPLSAGDRAEAQFRLGAQAMQQGRMRDAEASFLAAIAEEPGHVPSRQALLGIYLEAQRRDEAEVLLRDGLKASPRPPAWAMVLARLEAERGDVIGGINTMQNHLDVGRQNGDYVALFAALLQRQGRHADAIEQYQNAINLGNAKSVWFMGQGISLRESGRRDEARAAFQRALDGGGLSNDIKLFLERQIAALRLPASN